MPKKSLAWKDETAKPHYDKNIVQVDVENPAQDRNGRFSLNATEREIFRMKEAISQWTPGSKLPDILKTLGHPTYSDGNIYSQEIERLSKMYPDLFEAIANRIAERDLDITQVWREDEIAAECGLNRNALIRLRRSEEFSLAYNRIFGERRRDPRMRATEEKLIEMVPDFVFQLRQLMTTGSPGVKLGALKLYQGVMGFQVDRGGDDNVEEWKKMLAGADIETVNINLFQVAPEYADALREPVLEGQVVVHEPSDASPPEPAQPDQ